MRGVIRDGIIPFYQREFRSGASHSFSPLYKLAYKSTERKPNYVWTTFNGSQEEFDLLSIKEQKKYIAKLRTFQVKKFSRNVTTHHLKSLANDFNGVVL